MYTQCPECETTFKLGADDLRRANGKVRCGDCDTVFNALEYLAEQVAETADTQHGGWTNSTANPAGDLDPDIEVYEEAGYSDTVLNDDEDDDEDGGSVLYIDEGEDPVDDELPSENDDSLGEVWEDIPGIGTGVDDADDWQPEDEAAEEADDPEIDDPSDKENLEFNVPENKWDHFFGPLPEGQSATVWSPPALGDNNPADNPAADEITDEDNNEFGSVNDEEAQQNEYLIDEGLVDEGATAEPETTPDWRDSGEPGKRRGLILAGTLALAVALTSQLIHYNRDSLAANPDYGSRLRQIYDLMGSELYPDWDIGNYEIRGSEAIAGESGQDILDIRAQIANTGNHVTGLPRLRVVLRDRWSNPVAAQDFGPEEYARGDAMPEGRLLQPSAVIDSHISIQDPGSGAQGFELELCLPRRHTGLECTDQPFK